MLGRGKLAAVVAVTLVSALTAPAASAQVNAFSISADRDVEQIDGRSKSYTAAQGRFTTGPQPFATDGNNRLHKQIAGAVESTINPPRTYVVRVYLPADTKLELGRAYPVNGTLSSGGAGMELTLASTICGVTSGSFTVNEYTERADATPTAMDISFTGTCAYYQAQTATFTGRYRLNASGATPRPPAPVARRTPPSRG